MLNSLIFNLPWMLGNRMSPLDVLTAAIWPAGILLELLSVRFIYWEADEHEIHEHRFWWHRVAPYSQITRVTRSSFWMDGTIVATVESPKTDAPKKRKLYLNPGKAEPLVELLRSHVPEAAIQL